MSHATASQLDRVFACPASAVLPQIEHGTSEAAERGTAIHRFLATGELPVEKTALEICEALDLSALPVDRSKWSAEVSLALDLDTGAARELGRMLDRNYPPTKATEQIGTADALGIADGGATVVVIDAKTGHGRKTPASRSQQLRFLAVAAARAYGCHQARVALCHIKDDGGAWWQWHELDAFALEEAFIALRRLRHQISALAKVASARPLGTGDVRTGEHCVYCPARLACPAKTAVIREWAQDPAGAAEGIRKMLTPETARAALIKVREVREAMRVVESALHAYAKENPIRLPDGRVFGPHETRRELMDGNVAYRVLAEKWGADVALNACEMDATKASIERAAKKLAPKTGEKPTHIKRAMIDAVRAAGGVTQKVSVTVGEYEPDDEPKELPAA